jgi:hypothetical protein
VDIRSYEEIKEVLSDIQETIIGDGGNGSGGTGRKASGERATASAREILRNYRQVVPAGVGRKLAAKTPTGDRSKVLWALINGLLEVGLSPGEVVVLVERTVWNKFGEDRSRLWADVNKAASLNGSGTAKKVRKAQEEAVRLDRYLAVETSDPTWMIEGLWTNKSHGIMAGEPKTRKSYLAIDIALSVATGTKCLGHFAVKQAGPVLLIQEEIEDAEMKKRLRHIAMAKGLGGTVEKVDGSIRVRLPEPVPLYLRNRQGFDLTNTGQKDGLRKEIEDKEIKLLILDPLQMMLGDADENRASEIRPILVWLLQLKEETGCAILILHHFGKDTEKKGGRRLLGSQAFHAWTSSALFLEKEGSTTRVEREFRNFEVLPNFTVDYVGEEGTYEVEVTEDEVPSRPSKFDRTCFPLCGKPIRVVCELLGLDRRVLMKEIAESNYLDVGERKSKKTGRPLKMLLRKRKRRERSEC